MAALTAKRRSRLKAATFAVPGKRKYPLTDRQHAANALARVAQHGTPTEKKQVRAAVRKKFPTLPGVTKNAKTTKRRAQ